MTASRPGTAESGPGSRWRSPLAGRRFDTSVAVRPEEALAIQELGVDNLRRLQRHDPSAPGWRMIRRLLRPLDAVNAEPDSPSTPHRRRAMLDVVALLLVRSVELSRTFWGWTAQEWVDLLGRNQAEFRRDAPAWVGDEVRPYLAAHACILGGFTEFHRIGGFQRLALSQRVFGRDRVNDEIARLRAPLAEWGYQLGLDDDLLLPLVACQLFLLNRSPHSEDLSTELFDRVRRESLLNGTQLNCLYAVQRAVAALGFCDPPHHLTGGHAVSATGGAPAWEQWVERWHATSTLTPRTRRNVRSKLLKVGRWLAAEQPEVADPTTWTRQTCAAWVAALDRMVIGDYVQRTAGLKDRVGKPLEASSKEGLLSAVRGFFTDCQGLVRCAFAADLADP